MRQPVALNNVIVERATRSGTISIPAPYGGWNQRDAWDDMSPVDAIELDNWFPTHNRVESRKGFTQAITGLGSSSVDTVTEFYSGTTRKLIAACSGGIFDCTTSPTLPVTPTTATLIKGGYNGNRWMTFNMGGSMAFIQADPDNRDAPQVWDGTTATTFTAMTLTSITTGVTLTANTIIGGTVFKNRSYFWQKDSQDFWYSAINALGGNVTRFPLSRVTQFGGNLISIGTWTLDSGSGIDDLIVFVMDSGDVAVYSGTNPGDASFVLNGIYRIGAPLDPFGIVKMAGDLLIMTQDGYVSMSTVLRTGRITAEGVLSDKISGAVRDAVRDYENNTGWQAILYPRSQMMLFNVPTSTTVYHQHVYNIKTGAWCRFTGQNARKWGVYKNRLYFGGTDGSIYLADDGDKDNGSAIKTVAQPAWTYLGNRGQRKKLNVVNPAFATVSDFTLRHRVRVDYSDETAGADGITYQSVGAHWDIAAWDSAFWASDNPPLAKRRLLANKTGENFSIHLKADISTQTYWYSTEYLFETGGQL